MFNRLRSAQLKFNSPKDILMWNRDQFDLMTIKDNLTFNVLKLCIHNDFSFRNIAFNSDLSIDIHNRTTINSFLISHDLSLSKPARNRLSQLNLFFMEQFINLDGTSTLSWRQLQLSRGLLPKGKTPNWFSSIIDLINVNKWLLKKEDLF